MVSPVMRQRLMDQPVTRRRTAEIVQHDRDRGIRPAFQLIRRTFDVAWHPRVVCSKRKACLRRRVPLLFDA